MAHITQTAQYQIYLTVIDALKQNGYGIQEHETKKSCARSIILKDSRNCGQVFVVADPKQGCLGALLCTIFPTIGTIRDSQTSYSIMQATIEHQQQKNRKTYWPNHSLVGGYANLDIEYEWLSIVQSIIG